MLATGPSDVTSLRHVEHSLKGKFYSFNISFRILKCLYFECIHKLINIIMNRLQLFNFTGTLKILFIVYSIVM